MSRVRWVTTPSAPSATHRAREVGLAAADRSTSEPSAVTSSTARTAVGSEPLRMPEPCVPVAQAPATEMCGSEPRLCRAIPLACSAAGDDAVPRAAGDPGRLAVAADLDRLRQVGIT